MYFGFMQTTYSMIFRHPRGYKAEVKVKAASEQDARRIFAERKPNAELLSVSAR